MPFHSAPSSPGGELCSGAHHDLGSSYYKDGHATKAQYAEALLGYRDAVEEMESSQRKVMRLGSWNTALTQRKSEKSKSLQFK